MTYTDLVSENKARFDTVLSLKLASDLAGLLDEPFFKPQLKITWEDQQLSKFRLKTFKRFCRLCLHAGVATPPYEDCFWRVFLLEKTDPNQRPSDWLDQARRVSEFVNQKLAGVSNSAADSCRALTEVFLLLTNSCRGDEIKVEILNALISRLLVDELGLTAVEPDYALVELPEPPIDLVPKRDCKALVVDDSLIEIFKTLVALAGWPGFSLNFLHCPYPYGAGNDPQQKKLEIEKTVNLILESKPDIVFMDQGMIAFDGSEVIPLVRQQNGNIFFIANTGGSAEKLLNAGCVFSFAKGDNRLQLGASISYWLYGSRFV